MKLFKFLCCSSPNKEYVVDVSLPIHDVLKVWIKVFIEDDVVLKESAVQGGVAWSHFRAHARTGDLEIFVLLRCVLVHPL